jgi:hypothetical protein
LLFGSTTTSPSPINPSRLLPVELLARPDEDLRLFIRTLALQHAAYSYIAYCGYVPIITGEPRRIVADAKLSSWVARISQVYIEGVLAERPQWHCHV